MANGSKLAEELLDSVNSGVNPEELSNEVANGHRYLQSEVFKQIIKPIICEFARQAESGNYDRRNKDTLERCHEIAEAMNWNY